MAFYRFLSRRCKKELNVAKKRVQKHVRKCKQMRAQTQHANIDLHFDFTKPNDGFGSYKTVIEAFGRERGTALLLGCRGVPYSKGYNTGCMHTHSKGKCYECSQQDKGYPENRRTQSCKIKNCNDCSLCSFEYPCLMCGMPPSDPAFLKAGKNQLDFFSVPHLVDYKGNPIFKWDPNMEKYVHEIPHSMWKNMTSLETYDPEKSLNSIAECTETHIGYFFDDAMTTLIPLFPKFVFCSKECLSIFQMETELGEAYNVEKLNAAHGKEVRESLRQSTIANGVNPAQIKWGLPPSMYDCESDDSDAEASWP